MRLWKGTCFFPRVVLSSSFFFLLSCLKIKIFKAMFQEERRGEPGGAGEGKMKKK